MVADEDISTVRVTGSDKDISSDEGFKIVRPTGHGVGDGMGREEFSLPQ